MRRIVVFDPMAGERARRIYERPEEPQPILDPTDPRYGSTDPDRIRRAGRKAGRRRDLDVQGGSLA